MVEIEYKIEDDEPKWQKIPFIVAVVFLVLLVPSTALGYYAEKSIPGQILYPVKRGIEAGFLALESFTPYGKSTYLLSLADTRINETTTLVENAKVSGDFGDSLVYSDGALVDIVNSVKEAQSAIDKISDPVKKQEAEKNLANSIQKYENNLQKIVVVIHEPSTDFSSMQNSSTPTTTPTPTSNTAENNNQLTPTIAPTSTPTPTSASNTAENNNQVTPTPSPTPASDNTQPNTISNSPSNTPNSNQTSDQSSQIQLTQQIQQTQDSLQQIQSQLNVAPDVNLLPTPTVSPTTFPTATPTPFWMHNTPTPERHHRDGYNYTNGSNSDN